MKEKKPIVLTIMDGYGINPEKYGNAIANAKKPNLDQLFSQYPYTVIDASGEAVGLPAGQMGNSEVGHLNIGAGRIVYQSLTRVDIAVRDQVLDQMDAINEAIENAIAKGSNLHIMGLLSDGGVHSRIDHIIYLMKKAHERGVKQVYVHAYLDGRDVPPQSAAQYFDQLVANLVPGINIGIVSGRYYAMDRDKNYDRVQKAYDALVYGIGPVYELYQGLEHNYQEGLVDEFVIPYIVTEGSVIQDHDSVIFANFRPDRAIQMSLALTNPDCTTITNPKYYQDLTFVQMMLYSDEVKGKVNFQLQSLQNMLGDVLAKVGLSQLRIAETEKYAHVTYFFDGGVDKTIEGADRILVGSPKVETYDLMPQMSAYEVTDKVVDAINSRKYDVIILNLANCDMVGHTAVYDAAIKAVEVVDQCVGRIYQAVDQNQGILLLTADHGNADKIFDLNGAPFSAHTTNPVPFCLVAPNCADQFELRATGNLGDIAPTILDLLGVNQPQEMTGVSLIKK